MEERVNPIKITDKETGEVYELDFSKESVSYMERQGFVMGEELFNAPLTNIPKLFYYALRKNHRKMSITQANALLDKMGGLTTAMIERLFQLYNQAVSSNNVLQDEEDSEKNVRVAVEMD